MKKRISLLVAVLMAALFVLSAVPAMAEKTVITYWSNDRHDETYMTAMIEKFNTEHDDIEINMVIMTDDFENSILLAIDGGTAPDLVGQSVTLKNMVDYDAVVDLTPYIEADEEYQKVTDALNLKFEGLNAIGDSIYWVPSGQRSGVRIEYNKALLEASGFEGIPSTLAEYVEMAKKITEDGKAKFYKETTEKRLVNGRYQNVTYYKGLPQKAGDPDTPEKSLDTTKMPGICMYVKGKMEVSGDVKGRVTLSSTDNCYVVDDIQYVDDNNCVLGLTSENNIIVRTDKNVQRDLYLSAMLMALKGSFTVENYSSGRYRGQLHLFGGVVQKTRGAVATGTGSSTSTGYEKDYVYDPKLVTYPPLNFPNTGKYYLRYFIDKGSLGGV